MSLIERDLELLIERRSFTHVFQPIFHLGNQQIIAYESLLRCQMVSSPEILFHRAKSLGKLYELDMVSIFNALNEFSMYQGNNEKSEYMISLNVFPSTIIMSSFPDELWLLVKKIGFIPQQIILEVNESERVEKLELMNTNICRLKEMGFFVALDDVGKGAYPLSILLEIKADIVKLDRYFSKGLAKEPKKQSAILGMMQMFKDSKIILEGIETEEDLRMAKFLGVMYGQGYHLARPMKL
ncbi:EAL domain-containing protein [Anoxybacillus salavatliensis]|uniref:EAL domain-containing protein n=1 Tax=Anoxybacillus gonensis TaxID=198467 RepID=UPI00214C2EBE|nr:EAL domain-containing protein [Anoxybacillus gonensis]MCQ5366124.1 EAL domain-containing protein [Anoxybacillus gonensis]